MWLLDFWRAFGTIDIISCCKLSNLLGLLLFSIFPNGLSLLVIKYSFIQLCTDEVMFYLGFDLMDAQVSFHFLSYLGLGAKDNGLS